jgi:hypothetical protein
MWRQQETITRVLGYYNGLLFQEEISDMEYEEYLHELAEKLHKLQEETQGQVESEKVRVMADVVLAAVQQMQDFDDRLRALEGRPR